jgi:hypothetical protein
MRHKKNRHIMQSPPAASAAKSGFQRPDIRPGMPFTQTSPEPVGSMSPHEQFHFFTYEIILEKKVFVR